MVLHRVLETEIMSARAEALEYQAIDHAQANAGLAGFLAGALGFERGRLLDLGTGPGDIPVAICGRIIDVKIIAVDLSPAMLALAAKKIKCGGLSGRIRLLRADAKKTGLRAASFDFVLCSSVVHHLAYPAEVFMEIKRLCRPGAGFYVRDLRRPLTELRLKALLRRAAGDTPLQKKMLENSLRAALSAEEAEILAVRSGLEGFTVEETGDRHWHLYRAAGRPSPVRKPL